MTPWPIARTRSLRQTMRPPPTTRRALALSATVLLLWSGSALAQPAPDADADPPTPPPGRSPIRNDGIEAKPMNLPKLEPMPRLPLSAGAPLGLDAILGTVFERYPVAVQARLKLRESEGKVTEAQGGLDLKVKGKLYSAPLGYYTYSRGDVGVEQQTTAWGAQLFGGYRTGVGKIPDYYGEYRTLYGGELYAGVRVPLLQGRAVDPVRAKLRSTDRGLDVAQRALEAKMLELRATVADAYWMWSAAGQNIRIKGELLDLAEARDQQVLARVIAGDLEPIAQLQNRQIVLSRRQEWVQARRKLEKAALKLAMYARDADGLPAPPPPQQLPALLPAPEPLRQGVEARALELALEGHPEVARAQSALEVADIAVELADNDVQPQLDVELGTSQDVGPGDPAYDKTLKPWVVYGGLVFELPVQQRKARGKLAQAEAKRSQAFEDLRLARDRVRLGVLDALSAYNAALEQAEMADTNAAAASAVAEAERRKFLLGASDLVKLNLVEGYAAKAAIEQADARAALQIARAKLEAAAGASWNTLVGP